MILDDTSVMLTKKEFDELPEYSCTLPTLTTIGKRWKRGEPYVGPRTHWYMGEYVELDPTQEGIVGIKWREIEVGTLDVMAKLEGTTAKCSSCEWEGTLDECGKDADFEKETIAFCPNCGLLSVV